MLPLILAKVEPGQIIGLVVVVISVLSWLVNVIQGNTPDGAPRQRQNKPKPQTSRNEIEELLQELTADKRRPKPEPPRPRPQPEKAKSKQKVVPPRPGAPPPYAPSRPTSSRPSTRPMESSAPPTSLGGGIRSQQLGNRVDTAVQQDVTLAVEADLGSRSSVTAPREVPVHPLVKILRDPVGVRQAILLNEILQRPQHRRR